MPPPPPPLAAATSANDGGSSNGASPEPSAAWSFEYYIHYINFDRRLDEWVTADRVDMAAGEQRAAAAAAAGGADPGSKRRLTRQKRKYDDTAVTSSKAGKRPAAAAAAAAAAALALLEREHEEVTKVKNIQRVEMGRYEMETWYFSPYPDDYSRLDRLYVCEFCLKYMRKRATLERHRAKCEHRAPPGDEIYRDGSVSLFEVDGKASKVYCQNLCLLSKLFLDHKTLYYDVNPFLFYVLCEVDSAGAHIVGYFSKEKSSPEEYNLACILTFPPYQRKGYGKLLISLSYELTKLEETVGSPEKPLSDLGKLSYRSYWTFVLLTLLRDYDGRMSVRDVSRTTGIKPDDIISTLQSLSLIKYWKGQHVIAVSKRAIDRHLSETRAVRLARPECIKWTPPADKKGGSSRR
ncbi:unnamed protein product [Phaeothamnion confervicola]